MILLPTHACSGDDGLEPASEPYGEIDRENVSTCSVRIRWGEQRWQDVRLPGCGARIGVCHGCGLRTRVTLPGEVKAPPCPACSATERPEVMHVRHVESGTEAGRERRQGQDAAGAGADSAMGSAHVRADVPGQGGAGSRRPEETKAPSKPRAPQKRVKKGPAATDGPTLPGVK